MPRVPDDVAKAFDNLKLTRYQAQALREHINSRGRSVNRLKLPFTPRQFAMHLQRARAKMSTITDARVAEAIIDHIEALVRSLTDQDTRRQARNLALYSFPEAAHPSELAGALLKVLRVARRAPVKALTDRQELVLVLHCAGVSDGRIAAKLKLNKSTVREQRVAAAGKLRALIESSARRSRNRYLCGVLLDMAGHREHKAWGQAAGADVLYQRANVLLRRLTKSAN